MTIIDNTLPVVQAAKPPFDPYRTERQEFAELLASHIETRDVPSDETDGPCAQLYTRRLAVSSVTVDVAALCDSGHSDKPGPLFPVSVVNKGDGLRVRATMVAGHGRGEVTFELEEIE